MNAAVVKKFIIYQVLDKLLTQRMTAWWLSIWARLVIRSRRPRIIGVTGSVGKTTTTNMIAAVLTHPEASPAVGRVRHASRNMNDDLGVPLTVLGFDHWVTSYPPSRYLVVLSAPLRALAFALGRAEYADLLVLEFGTHWQGHLHRLVDIAPPSIGVVTAIAPAHLERLKTLEGVVREKSAIVRAVPTSGLVILGQDHDFVAQLARQARSRVVTVPGRGIELARAITREICRELRVPDELVERVLKDFKPPKGRLNRIELGNVSLIDDCFNANPLSMKLALDTLAEAAGPGRRRVAILGPMAELGDQTQHYHDEIGAYAAERADLLVGVGDLGRRYDPDHWFESSRACAEGIAALIDEGDCVLVKGSSSAQMRRIVDRLCDEQAPSETAQLAPPGAAKRPEAAIRCAGP